MTIALFRTVTGSRAEKHLIRQRSTLAARLVIHLITLLWVD
jgi:hypothetical protein